MIAAPVEVFVWFCSATAKVPDRGFTSRITSRRLTPPGVLSAPNGPSAVTISARCRTPA